MMREKKIGSRVTIFHIARGITIQIRSPKQVYPLLFLPVWLTGWSVAGVMVVKRLISGNAPPFLVIWLCGWLFGEIFAIYTFLWTAFGREIISVEEGILTVKREIFGYGLRREFPIHSLNNLRASGHFGSKKWNSSTLPWGLSEGTIAVDQLDKTYRFGINLEEREALAVAKELQPYLPKPETLAQ